MVGVGGTMASMSDPEDAGPAIDDSAAWGAPKRGRKSEKRQRSAVVSVRLSQAELELIQEKARERGETIGTYMRQAAMDYQPSLPWGNLRTPAVVPNLTGVMVTERHTTPYTRGWKTEAVGISELEVSG